MAIIPSPVLSGDYTRVEPLLRSHFQDTVHFRKGDVIFHLMDDRSKVCYYVISGIAAFTHLHESGRSKVHSYRGPGTIFPLYYSFASATLEHTLEVTAVTEMDVIRIKKEAFCDLMCRTPELVIATCDAWGKFAINFVYESYSKAFASAEMRVCSYLYIASQSAEFCDGDAVKLSHSDIGLAVGLARENVSRIMSQLSEEKIISVNRRKIKILRPDKLLHRSSQTVSSEEEGGW